MNPIAADTIVYFDGTSNRRHLATLDLADALDVVVDGETKARWAWGDIRRADSAPGTLRLSCLTAPSLARLEIRDAALAARLVARAGHVDDHQIGRRGIVRIVGWSLAAAVSIVLVVLFGVPFAADRLAPLVPASFEARLGDVAEKQVKLMFGTKTCENEQGQRAFTKLVNTVRAAAGLDTEVQ